MSRECGPICRTAGRGLDDHGAVGFGPLLRLTLALTLIVAVLWGVHTAVLLQAAKRYWTEEAGRRLVVMTDAIAAEIQTRAPTALVDPAFLKSLAERYGAQRISILDRDGGFLADTLSQNSAGLEDPLRDITSVHIRRVWDGESWMAPLSSNPSGMRIRAYFVPLQDPEHGTVGVLRVDLETRPLETNGPAAVTALLLKVVGATVIAVLAFYSFRALTGRHRQTTGGKSSSGETAVVIDAFHGLVRQLKEKEQEMERLRALAEERAAEVESYNENILQSVTSGVITFNTERVMTTFNHAAEQILGLSRTIAVGKTCEEMFGPQGSIAPLLDQALTRQSTITREELLLSRRNDDESDPQRIWVGVSTSLLRDRQGALIGTTFVFTDLTEIKSLQEQVELKRRLTVLGEMSAGIAHEFRNYMGTVMGYTKLLSKRLPPSDAGPDTGREMVASILRELTAMNQLIEQLLSFGRHAELNLQPVALGPLIRPLLDQLVAQAPGAKPQLEVTIPPDLPAARMDEVLMRQALGNLIQNALDAMPQGGRLQIRAALLGPGLHAGTSRGAGARGPRRELSLEIRDTGVGIPKDKLDKIFLPFYTTKEKGTGMGLALVHKIILSHGGRIEVDSREDYGTAFRIVMPVTA